MKSCWFICPNSCCFHCSSILFFLFFGLLVVSIDRSRRAGALLLNSAFYVRADSIVSWTFSCSTLNMQYFLWIFLLYFLYYRYCRVVICASCLVCFQIGAGWRLIIIWLLSNIWDECGAVLLCVVGRTVSTSCSLVFLEAGSRCVLHMELKKLVRRMRTYWWCVWWPENPFNFHLYFPDGCHIGCYVLSISLPYFPICFFCVALWGENGILLQFGWNFYW